MPVHSKVRAGERGIALIMALVSLLVIAVIAMVLMVSLNVERKLSGHDMRDAQALNLAEAGVAEAVSRIRNFDITLPVANPRAVAQIFLTPAGSVPVLGTDSVGIETKQPAGDWLTYSTATKGRDALTVEFKTDKDKTKIYRYDASKNPAIQTVSGLPIYRITSTGQKGRNKVRVQSDVIQKPFNVLVHGAFAAGVPMNFSGNSRLCGHNHSANTPTGVRPVACDAYRTFVGDLPGAWGTNSISSSGASNQYGTPPTQCCNTNQFYSGVWDAFGMGQSEYYNWIGAPTGSEPTPANGIIHLDNNGTTLDKSGDFAYHSGNGEGFLYVDGDLSVNSNFNYRGLIFCEGDIKINGTCWILGGLICRGNVQIHIANGTFTVLYSKEAIEQALAKYGGQFVTLKWREVPLN